MLPQRNVNLQATGIENSIRWRLQNFSDLMGYPIQNTKYLRKIGPPLRPTTIPAKGSEVFSHRLPSDALEDELFWFFQRAGDIYEIRLMLRPSGIANRGFAFVRYFNPQQAQHAIATLSKEDFRPHYKISLQTSAENNRLFLNGVPLNKTKGEIFDELLRAGLLGVVDVIVHKGYKKGHANRGYVFIEFETHEDAAGAKREFSEMMRMWNQLVILDWAVPMRDVDAAVMAKVTRVFLRNLNYDLKKEKLMDTLEQVLDLCTVEKVYKHMDYCFIHFFTREMAEKGLKKLQEHYCNTDVEVTWSKPPGTSRNRTLPPRLQKKKNDNRTKSATNQNNHVNVELQNTQFQHTPKEESDHINHKYEKFEEFMKESSRPKNCSKYNENENNANTWELWKNNFDCFDRFVGKRKNTEKHAQDLAILTDPCNINEHSNDEDRCEEQYLGLHGCIEDGIGCHLVDQNSADEKRCGELIQDSRSSSFREAANQSLNLRFHLDLYYDRGSKCNAS